MRHPLVLAVRQLGAVAFARVLDLIREDGASERAVMTMFRPEELAVPGNTDVACPPSLVQTSLAATTGRL